MWGPYNRQNSPKEIRIFCYGLVFDELRIYWRLEGNYFYSRTDISQTKNNKIAFDFVAEFAFTLIFIELDIYQSDIT